MSLNKIMLIGNLGRDPETRSFPNGDQVTNVSIATKETWKDKATGEKKEATEWHRIQFTGALADVASKYLKKGSQIYVEGPLKSRKWIDKDGVEKTMTEVRATTMTMLGTPGGVGAGASNAAVSARGDHGYAHADYEPEPHTAQRSSGYRSQPQSSVQRPPAPVQRTSSPAPSTMNSGFDDMDDDIPFITQSFYFDATSSKQRKMARYDF